MDIPLPLTRRLELSGPAGRLDARIDLPPDDPGVPRFAAVFGHPHPQQGGTMFNNVVVHAARTLVHHGGAVLRFDFRGVGKSEGSYDEGVGEKEDYLAALRLLEQSFPGVRRLAAGFSFGSIRAMECAEQAEADLYLGVAPPITLSKYTRIPIVRCPAALILAGEDELVPAPDAEFLATHFLDLRAREVVAGAGHLFTNKLPELRAAVERALLGLTDQLD